jgi:hypothetical protein
MTVVTLTGFTPLENVMVFPWRIGEVWVRQMGQTPPSTPTAMGGASATGVYAPNLPDNQEFLAFGLTSRISKQVVIAATQGGSAPWAPA